MKLSYVIVTRNRRDTLLATLDRLERDTRLPRHAWEIFVIDNASDDDTPSAVAALRRDIRIIRLPENEGVPARNHAIPLAAGRYCVFLDDDSYPLNDAIPQAVAYLNRHTKTAALVARVLLPSGAAEAPAFPNVTIGGASIIRTAVLREIGGFAPEFFRQAEEYELSCRIWKAGYRVERFEDICFGHDKVPDPTGRASALTHRMDLRNNLIVVERYLPRELRRAYRKDFIDRYAALAFHDGQADAVNAALHEARIWARREAEIGRRTLDAKTVEAIFDLKRQSDMVAKWAKEHRIARVAIGDYSKNIYATYAACRQAGLKIGCLLDERPAFRGLRYRTIPIWQDADAQRAEHRPDGIVLSNVNPAQCGPRFEQLRERFPMLPILRLWEPRFLQERTEKPPAPAPAPARSVA